MILTSLLRTLLTRSPKPFVFEGVNGAEAKKPLDYTEEKNLGLYVHIPFCRSICAFCPYCKVLYDEQTAEEYISALLKEIALVGNELIEYKPAGNGLAENGQISDGKGRKQDFQKKRATSLYFGGGSPGLLAHSLGSIITELKKYFIIEDGIGVELHPSDITKETLSVLKKAGVTMVSTGIQSFDDKCLASLGRNTADYGQIFSLLKDAKFDVIDVDLIFAIPGQTIEILKADILKAFELGATQISTYPFIDFTYADNKEKPLKEKYKKEMLYGIAEFCREQNLDRTSVWTFAKKGTQKYSSITRDSFLGFGVSATSLLKTQFKLNTFSISDYIKRVDEGIKPTSLRVNFSLYQRAAYYLFWSAYGMKINEKSFYEFFNASLSSMYGFEMTLAFFLGLVSIEKNTDENGNTYKTYTLTDKGAYYYHFIEQQYTTSYIDKMWSISRLESWPEKIILR